VPDFPANSCTSDRDTPSDYLIELYRETLKNDLSRINGDPSWTVPMPGRYVIGTDGVVAYAGLNPITPASPTRSSCCWCFQL
jgi:hypothetical protein